MTEVSFGEWLKRQRNSRGLTQEQLAHQIGCATITLRKIESEERHPSAQIAERLADIFDIPANDYEDFLRYARGALRYAPGDREVGKPWRESKASPRTNLPSAVTKLIGREQELSEVHEYLMDAEIRLVTLIGPPGIGKTRLGIEAANRSVSDFPDGVYFVALAPLDNPTLIASITRQSLGYVESQRLTADQQLMNGIGNKRMLIVLDNCEHLIKDVTQFASDLLSACPNLKILATSRELLRIPGEWLYTVPPLKSSDESLEDHETLSSYPALILFTERARAVQKDFTLTPENIQAVSSICAHLDGLPLAIELVAAQTRVHSPQSLLERLNDQFILSVEGARNAPRRQISLSHAINWSYVSLKPEEQRLFAYLSVFSGGFTFDAAETIFSEKIIDKPIPDLIVSLLDKSLLQRSTDPDGEPRFHMLVSICYFAADQLQRIDDMAKVRDWHLTYFVELAEHADAEVRGPNQVEWMDRLEKEMDNFRGALGWCVSEQNTEVALRLLNALKSAWARRGYFTETENWFKKIRKLPNVMDYPGQYASLLNAMASNWLNKDAEIARSMVEESRDIWRGLGTEGERGLAEALDTVGYLALHGEDDIEEARALFESSLEIAQKYKDEREIAWLTYRLGEVAYVAGQYAGAEEKYLASLAKFRELGDKGREAYVLGGLGELARMQGDYKEAEKFWTQNLEIFRELRAPYSPAFPYHALASVSFRLGEYDKAKRWFGESLKLFMENRDRDGIVVCLAGLAGVLGVTGKPEQAARLLGAIKLLLERALPMEPADQRDFDNYIAITLDQLDGKKFEELIAEGYSMTMEEAIAYALEEDL